MIDHSTYLSRIGRHWQAQSSRKKWCFRLVGLVGLGLIGWGIGTSLLAPPKKTPTPPVTVAKVVQQDVDLREHVTGTVLAEATVNVTARVGGEIVAIAFAEGHDVKKGDVLFRLDPRPLQAALAQARANLARDTATMTADARDAQRNLALAAQGAVSAQARDQAVAAAKAAEATVAADKALVQTAALNLEYATIRAPIDGKTGAVMIQIGNQVVANAVTPLVTLTQDRPVKVSFVLPQDRIARIQKQMRTGGMQATIAVDGLDRPILATVDFVGNTVSDTTGTIELRAHVPNADRALVPGQMVSVDVTTGRLKGALVVPAAAINPSTDKDFVFVVSHDTVRRVDVRVRFSTEQIAAIEGKLKPGDTVVTDGQLRIKDGGKVRISGHGAGKRALTAPGAQ